MTECTVSVYCVKPPLTGVRDDDNSTILHWACLGENKETVQYLVEELKCDVGEL